MASAFKSKMAAVNSIEVMDLEALYSLLAENTDFPIDLVVEEEVERLEMVSEWFFVRFGTILCIYYGWIMQMHGIENSISCYY